MSDAGLPRCARTLHRLVAISALCAGVLTAAAAATTSDPSARLQQAIVEVLDAAYPRASGPHPPPGEAALRTILERYFDTAKLTRRAVGPGWNALTPEQKERTIALFSDLVFRTYAGRFGSGSRPVVTYLPVTMVSPSRAETPTIMTQGGKQFAVAFRWEPAAGEWRVCDLVVEGISLVSNYRAQFTALGQRGGGSAIIAALEAKLAESPAEPK